MKGVHYLENISRIASSIEVSCWVLCLKCRLLVFFWHRISRGRFWSATPALRNSSSFTQAIPDKDRKSPPSGLEVPLQQVSWWGGLLTAYSGASSLSRIQTGGSLFHRKKTRVRNQSMTQHNLLMRTINTKCTKEYIQYIQYLKGQ